ncbi:MAG: hypothetical protein R3F55_06665 [Alphaproteobacteria bacterium]
MFSKSASLVLVGAALAGPFAASAASQEPWPFVSLEVFRYASLVDTNEDVGIACCAPHVIQAPGYALIHVSAVIDVPWSAELDRVSVSASKLTMTVPGGEPLAPIGDYDRRGLFESAGGGISASRPRDWPENEEPEYLEIEQVWLLPEDAMTAILILDEFYSVPIEFPAEVSEPISPADTADFAITGFALLDSLSMTHTINRQDVAGTVIPAAGRILRVDFDITPLIDSSVGGNAGYLIYTRYMQLAGPDGLPQVPLGQYLGDGLITDTSNSYSGNAFIGASFDESFYWLTDGAPGTYTLYYFNDPVGQITVE